MPEAKVHAALRACTPGTETSITPCQFQHVILLRFLFFDSALVCNMLKWAKGILAQTPSCPARTLLHKNKGGWLRQACGPSTYTPSETGFAVWGFTRGNSLHDSVLGPLERMLRLRVLFAEETRAWDWRRRASGATGTPVVAGNVRACSVVALRL